MKLVNSAKWIIKDEVIYFVVASVNFRRAQCHSEDNVY